MPVTGALRAAKDLLEARGIDDNDRKLRYILAFHRITSYGCLLARQAARTGNEGNLADICRKLRESGVEEGLVGRICGLKQIRERPPSPDAPERKSARSEDCEPKSDCAASISGTTTGMQTHDAAAESPNGSRTAPSEDASARADDWAACAHLAPAASPAAYQPPTEASEESPRLPANADEYALPEVPEPASGSPLFFLNDGADANAGLVGRCSTCGGPTHGDVALCRCGRVNHRRCLAPAARLRGRPLLCHACVARDRGQPDLPTLVEVCAGMGPAAAALHTLSTAGALSGFVPVAAIERAPPARNFLEALDQEMPGVRPRNVIADLLHVVTAERADLCVAGAFGLALWCPPGLGPQASPRCARRFAVLPLQQQP